MSNQFGEVWCSSLWALLMQKINCLNSLSKECIPVCQKIIHTARRSYEAITAVALHGVILIVWDAGSFITTRRTVRLTGTLCKIICHVLVLLQSLLFSSSKKNIDLLSTF